MSNVSSSCSHSARSSWKAGYSLCTPARERRRKRRKRRRRRRRIKRRMKRKKETQKLDSNKNKTKRNAPFSYI
jgi:hypothetical protein